MLRRTAPTETATTETLILALEEQCFAVESRLVERFRCLQTQPAKALLSRIAQVVVERSYGEPDSSFDGVRDGR